MYLDVLFFYLYMYLYMLILKWNINIQGKIVFKDKYFILQLHAYTVLSKLYRINESHVQWLDKKAKPLEFILQHAGTTFFSHLGAAGRSCEHWIDTSALQLVLVISKQLLVHTFSRHRATCLSILSHVFWPPNSFISVFWALLTHEGNIYLLNS